MLVRTAVTTNRITAASQRRNSSSVNSPAAAAGAAAEAERMYAYADIHFLLLTPLTSGIIALIS